MLNFDSLRSGPAAIVTGVLVLQTAAFYIAPTAEFVPNPPPLKMFQHDIGEWKMADERDMDPEMLALLRADDTLNRAYAGSEGPLTLYVGYFRSQRGGVTPHSPKICLPGNGWTPEDSTIVSLPVPGLGTTIPLNRYIVRHGEDRSLVLYWYSTAHSVIANEYLSKLYVMYEGLRHRRSDEAVFRVIVPLEKTPDSEARAEAYGRRFIQAVFPPLKQRLWSE